MNEQLKASFTDEERQQAADLGSSEDSVKEKAEALFALLADPLLSPRDVKELLGITGTLPKVREALDSLVTDGQLERDDETQRPFDKAGTVLYRRSGESFERLRLVGIEEELEADLTRLMFTFEGRLVRAVARVDRLDAISGEGQQRDEIKKHVEAIARSVSGGTQIPSPILLVLLAENVVEEDAEEEERVSDRHQGS